MSGHRSEDGCRGIMTVIILKLVFPAVRVVSFGYRLSKRRTVYRAGKSTKPRVNDEKCLSYFDIVSQYRFDGNLDSSGLFFLKWRTCSEIVGLFIFSTH